MWRAIGRASLAGSLMLALAACGTDTSQEAGTNGNAATASADSAAAASDPCGFVTKEEVAAATGEKIVQAQADGDRCSYQSEDAMAASLEVEVKRTAGAEEMEVARRAAGVLSGIGEDIKDAGGAEGDLGQALTNEGGAVQLGEEAFFGANQQLHVLSKGVYVAVTPPTMRSRMSSGNPMLSAEDKRKMAIAVAERVLSRL